MNSPELRPSSNRTIQLSGLAVVIARLDMDLIDSLMQRIAALYPVIDDTELSVRHALLALIEELCNDECLALERRISSGSTVTRSEKP